MTLRPAREPRSWLPLSFHRPVHSQFAWKAMQAIDDCAHRHAIIRAQLVEFDAESIGCGVMDHLAFHRQRFFTIDQQHQQAITDSDVGTVGKVTDSHAADAEVVGFTQSDRFSQSGIFYGQSETGIHEIAWKPAPLKP